MPGVLKVRDLGTGAWRAVSLAGAQGDPGATGPQGIQGEQGPTGVSSIIVGDFGAVATPATLPVDGLLPIDWDGPGNPAAPVQMNQGESLYYDRDGDPLDGHLFQYVTAAIDPAGWIDIGLIQGPPGPAGPTGADGVPGPPGPSGGPLPNGGHVGAPLTKRTTTDQDVEWGADVVMGARKRLLFPNEADVAKVLTYSNTFGVGIESGTQTYFASSKHRFRAGAAADATVGGMTAPEIASIETTGIFLKVAGHFNSTVDGYGLKMVGGAHIYKKIGAGLILRCASGWNEVEVENNDGTNVRKIITDKGGTFNGPIITTVSGAAAGLSFAAGGGGTAPMEFRYAADQLGISQFGRSNGLGIHPYTLKFMDITIADVNGPKMSAANQTALDDAGAAIAELRAEIQSLRARVAELETGATP